MSSEYKTWGKSYVNVYMSCLKQMLFENVHIVDEDNTMTFSSWDEKPHCKRLGDVVVEII